MKYVILDEIDLEVLKNLKGEKIIFDTETEAIEFGSEEINSWQVIEIAWHNDN